VRSALLVALTTAAVSCFRSPPITPTAMRGYWQVEQVGVDGKLERYGANRVFFEVTSDRLRLLECAYFTDMDSAGYWSHPERSCPVAGINCNFDSPLGVDGTHWRYSVTIHVPRCSVRDPNTTFGIRFATGAECGGVSPRPDHWPYVGASQSEVEQRGDELVLTHTAGREKKSRAQIIARRVNALPLPIENTCPRSDALRRLIGGLSTQP
jgi:hypothetical protein